MERLAGRMAALLRHPSIEPVLFERMAVLAEYDALTERHSDPVAEAIAVFEATRLEWMRERSEWVDAMNLRARDVILANPTPCGPMVVARVWRDRQDVYAECDQSRVPFVWHFSDRLRVYRRSVGEVAA
jgi:hypothetical protein